MKDNLQRRFLLPDYPLLTHCFPLEEDRYEIKKVEECDAYGIYDTILRDWYKSDGRMLFEARDIAEDYAKALPVTSCRATDGTGHGEYLLTGRKAAKRWLDRGVPIFAITDGEDNPSAIPVRNYTEINNHNGVYGIRPSDWIPFSETGSIRAYYYARAFFCDAVHALLCSDLDFINGSFNDFKSDQTFVESNYIQLYFQYHEQPSPEEIRPHLQSLLNEFTEDLASCEMLESYGWFREDIRDAILENLPEEMQTGCENEGLTDCGIQLL